MDSTTYTDMKYNYDVYIIIDYRLRIRRRSPGSEHRFCMGLLQVSEMCKAIQQHSTTFTDDVAMRRGLVISLD
jgi:hypothetical protein